MTNLITILGATATGKTTLAANLASLISGEIISADSRQIYKGMDIGTGKDLCEYTVNGKQIPTHLINIAQPGSRYNVFEYLTDFTEAFNKVLNNNNIPIMCGGSGMYLDAVLRGYQMGKVHTNEDLRKKLGNLSHNDLVVKLKSYGPLHNISDISDTDRLIRSIEIADYQSRYSELSMKLPEFNSSNFGIYFDRQILRSRITERLQLRLKEGMIDEVKKLLEEGIMPDNLIYYGLEYKFVTMFVMKQISYNEMFTKLNIAIHQFAKRQMTWYRRMEKNGIKIHWIDGSIDLNNKLAVILSMIKS